MPVRVCKIPKSVFWGVHGVWMTGETEQKAATQNTGSNNHPMNLKLGRTGKRKSAWSAPECLKAVSSVAVFLNGSLGM